MIYNALYCIALHCIALHCTALSFFHIQAFEPGVQSLDSTHTCEKTEIRTPEDYEKVHVIQSTEDRFGFHRNIVQQIKSMASTQKSCLLKKHVHFQIEMIVKTLTNLITIVFVMSMVYIMNLINKIVPDPYMDEIFHYPMTERYYAGNKQNGSCNSLGNYTYWDDKITTFPGLYIIGHM